MTQENVEWVRRVGEAWARGDAEAMEALLEGRIATDYEFHPLYLDRVHKGVDALRQVLAEEIVDLGEHVLVLAHITARGAGGGVPIDQRVAMLHRFRGEKLAWGKSFRSKREALEAVGLRE
jgi:ketosteroid isomerase-like protein